MIKFKKMPIITPESNWRFWCNILKTDCCWLWIGCKIGDYGRLTIKHQQYIATRISYWMHYKIDPGHFDVCHECNNPPCIRPDHLYLSTHSENMKQSVVDGRRNQYGSDNPKSKLKEEDISKILQLENDLTPKEIGRQFGVTDSCIEFVLNGTTWSHLTGRYK